MKGIRILGCILGLTILAGLAGAQTPGTLLYQGRLTDAGGNPVTSPTDVAFAIYDVAAGGVELWSEVLNVTPDEQGVFTVELGAGTPFPAGLFDGTKLYLGITIVSEGVEMTPRQPLVATPYAVSTDNIPNNSVTSAKVVNSSLTAADLRDEPGVAGVATDVNFSIGNSVLFVMTKDSITVPGPGYILVLARGHINISHSNGTSSNVVAGLSSDGVNILPNQQHYLNIPATAAGGVYGYLVSTHGLFSVASAGTYTYYLMVDPNGVSVSAFDREISLVYFPTTYGGVNTLSPEPPDGPNVMKADGTMESR